METAVALKETLSSQDIKKYIAPNATDKELFMFIGICKSYGLNPFKREIHFVKYGNAAASIIVGYESYIKRAERTGKLDGWKCWIEKDDIGEKAIIEIKRKDQSIPIRWEVYRQEFDKQQSTWKAMPMFMLKKVAIAQGFRLAFSEEVGGMPYIPEELPTTSNTSSESLPKDEIQTIEVVKQDDIPATLGNEPSFLNDEQKASLQAIIDKKNIDTKKFLTFMETDSIDHIIAENYGKAYRSLTMAKGQ